MWHLFQAVSVAEQNCFKILSQTNASSLTEAIRIFYGPSLPQKPSPDIKMTVDELPVVEEAPFTTVTNKKSKGKESVWNVLSQTTGVNISVKSIPEI